MSLVEGLVVQWVMELNILKQMMLLRQQRLKHHLKRKQLLQDQKKVTIKSEDEKSDTKSKEVIAELHNSEDAAAN